MALMIVLGAVVILEGTGYQMGTLTRMGAGYVPVVLGVLLIFVGLLIAVTTRRAKVGPTIVSGLVPIAPKPPKHGEYNGPQWRGWSCILAGVAAFVILGRWGGLVPATFAAVFISAMGDRNNTYKGAAILGAVLTVFCVVVFHYGLSLQLPLFQWGG